MGPVPLRGGWRFVSTTPGAPSVLESAVSTTLKSSADKLDNFQLVRYSSYPSTLKVLHLSLVFTAVNRTGTQEAVSDGSFGDVSAPIFIDRLDCVGPEDAIVNYGDREGVVSCPSSRVGYVFDSCERDLGVRCPGMLLAV